MAWKTPLTTSFWFLRFISASSCEIRTEGGKQIIDMGVRTVLRIFSGVFLGTSATLTIANAKLYYDAIKVSAQASSR